MKKTLGGDRLGSGKEMQVDLHGFERSTHDTSYIWRSTMASGTLVPFMKEVGLPGDTFDIHLNCFMLSLPTIGPLFGSYKIQLDVFMVPCRLYNSATHNNWTEIGLKMQQIKLPKVRLYADEITTLEDLDNQQVNPSCIFSYLGIRGIGTIGAEGVQYRDFNAVPWLAYWDIYKQYYSNKQEEEGVVIRKTVPNFAPPSSVFLANLSGSTAITTAGNQLLFAGAEAFIDVVGAVDLQSLVLVTNEGRINFVELGTADFIAPLPGWKINIDQKRWGNLVIYGYDQATTAEVSQLPIQLFRFPLEDIDLMRMAILQEGWNSEFIVGGIGSAGLEPYASALRVVDLDGVNYPVIRSTQEGLGIKTYQSDLFNNWLSTEWIDGVGGINEITAVDTSSGSFNIDALNLSKKVYDMLNRIAVSGGTYNDWVSAVYDHEPFRGAESPVYMGGLIKEFVFQEVISNSESNSQQGSQPLGTLAGKGTMGEKHKGGDIYVKCDEPCYIMGIISLTPRLDYSQGNKWDVNLDTWNDFHKPNLDQIGFQELITEQMAWWSTAKQLGVDNYVQKSAGKQPAWINYMTNVNEVRGNFAIESDSMFMTLNRKYRPSTVSTADISIADLTTYIDPSKFNSIFAQTSLDSQNFWAQISVDITARRKMSAKVMPNL